MSKERAESKHRVCVPTKLLKHELILSVTIRGLESLCESTYWIKHS